MVKQQRLKLLVAQPVRQRPPHAGTTGTAQVFTHRRLAQAKAAAHSTLGQPKGQPQP